MQCGLLMGEEILRWNSKQWLGRLGTRCRQGKSHTLAQVG